MVNNISVIIVVSMVTDHGGAAIDMRKQHCVHENSAAYIIALVSVPSYVLLA